MIKGESVFRGIAAALLAAALSVSAYYRHRAEQASEEKISWREEGLPTIIALRSSGLVLLLSVMAYLLNPRWMEWSSLSLPPWLRWSGAGLGAATLPLAYWVFRSLGKNITPTVETRENHELVTSGPYRWVRHPLYSVGTSFFVSLSVVAANWFIGLGSLSALAMLLVRLPKEEAKLIERFGDEYRVYMERTGRFLPRLRGPG
ncbi:MAG: isoprenylcysteine carboxylmethyltransferase family protein [Actinomycetota bacterium]|nr:isoprenylcysteine carboxylmethyltransferase family protein [Actinomycetota bacterium]